MNYNIIQSRTNQIRDLLSSIRRQRDEEDEAAAAAVTAAAEGARKEAVAAAHELQRREAREEYKGLNSGVLLSEVRHKKRKFALFIIKMIFVNLKFILFR